MRLRRVLHCLSLGLRAVPATARLLGALATLSLVLVSVAWAEPLLSHSDVAAYKLAFQRADAGEWPGAEAAAAKARNKTLGKVIRWLELQDPTRTDDFAAIVSFLARNPEWPRRSDLRLQAEASMPDDMAPADVVTYFDAYPPLSGKGLLRYIAALNALGRQGEVRKVVLDAWAHRDFSAADEKSFLDSYGDLIPADMTWARIDRLIWEGQTSAARRLLPRVDAGRRALATARIMLRTNAAGVDAAIRRVPRSLAADPGLLYDRIRWRIRHGHEKGAIELLARAPADLPYPDQWAAQRIAVARDLLDQGDAKAAYKVLIDHYDKSGALNYEIDWLAGWIALRKLDDPKAALDHFMTLYGEVSYPISRARGAYWAGRAAAALGESSIATVWYDLAAEHGQTFYGQLAAAKIGIAPRLAPAPQPSPAMIAVFDDNELTRIARQLDEVGADKLVGVFLTRLTDLTDSPGREELIARLALAMGRPDLAVMVARRALRNGTILVAAGYPTIALPKHSPVDPALALAVIRQESAFDPKIVSPAGARGLMQLMPSTARQVAASLGIHTTTAELTADPMRNLTLGTAYLADMIAKQDGSFVRAIAAYNAGPNRVAQWVRQIGDPRDSSIDVVDWIEEIPYGETRNYVQRVLEGMEVYRMLDGEQEAGLIPDMRSLCTRNC